MLLVSFRKFNVREYCFFFFKRNSGKAGVLLFSVSIRENYRLLLIFLELGEDAINTISLLL